MLQCYIDEDGYLLVVDRLKGVDKIQRVSGKDHWVMPPTCTSVLKILKLLSTSTECFFASEY
jgi:hypothetical protein